MAVTTALRQGLAGRRRSCRIGLHALDAVAGEVWTTRPVLIRSHPPLAQVFLPVFSMARPSRPEVMAASGP